ncbi:MAG: hypothetical protein RPV21_11415, partial [Candidatus Sedimenticola sp. (ex Thyasira tokunagai)]
MSRPRCLIANVFAPTGPFFIFETGFMIIAHSDILLAQVSEFESLDSGISVRISILPTHSWAI